MIRCGVFAAVAGFCMAASAEAGDPVLWLPEGLNAVMVVDVAGLYQTPLAKQELWAKRAAEAFLDQEIGLPPSVRRVLVAAELDLTSNLQLLRQFAVADMDVGTTIDAAAAISGADLEAIGAYRGMTVGNGGFLVAVEPQQWLVAAPGGRQAAARWIRHGAATKSRLSRYLESASLGAARAGQVMIALDLADAVTKAEAEELVLSLPNSVGDDAALKRLVAVLASIQGVSVSVKVQDVREARVRFDFSSSSAAVVPLAKPLLVGMLQRLGAALDDPDAWQVRSETQAIEFAGTISATGFKRLLSVLRPPSASIGAATATPGANSESMTIVASRKYFRSVQHELDDLRSTLKTTRDNHALWFERSARTIDNLPLLNVDSDLQTYGARVSSSLRYQSQAQRMSNMRKGTRQAQSGANTFYNTAVVNSFGNVSVEARSPGSNSIIALEENMAAKEVRFSEWKQIEDGLVQIRQAMTKKYQTEF